MRRFGLTVGTQLVDLSGRKTIFNASSKEPRAGSENSTAAQSSNKILEVKALYIGTVQGLSQRSKTEEGIDEMERKWTIALAPCKNIDLEIT